MTRIEAKQLERVGWGTFWFGTLASRYDRGNATLRSLMAMGLVARVENVVIMDVDGFMIQPERYGVGWTLTEAGVAACSDWRDEIQTKGRGPR